MNHSRVRVFIGSGEASLLERKTLIHSLRMNSRRDLDLYVFNGTHNSIEHINGEAPAPAPMSLRVKYTNVTEFSNYRFLIPQICSFQGRAIYLDSDMVALGDIGELFDSSMKDVDFSAKPEAYGASESEQWGLSVMVIDCARCRFDLEQILTEIERGEYTYEEFCRMSPKFLAKHPYRIGRIDPNWNMFDFVDEKTKLIHYTELLTQPWKFQGHRFGELWFQYFNEARRAGVITDRDIHISKLRAYVRQDILAGNNPPGKIRRILSRARHRAKRLVRPR